MATTLEEYQIVIAANAERASSGIDRFIGSLNNFKVSIGQAIAPAKAFAEAMKAIAGSASAMNLANIGTQAEKFAKAMRNAALANKSGGLYKPPASIKEAEALIHNYEEQDILKARREGLRNRLRDTMSMEMPDASKEANLVAQIQKTDAQMQALDNDARDFAQDLAKGASQVEVLNLKMNGIVKSLAFETSKKTLDSTRIGRLVAEYQGVAKKIAEINQKQSAASDQAKRFAENVARATKESSILEDKMKSVVAKIAEERANPNADKGKIASLIQQYQRLYAEKEKVEAKETARSGIYNEYAENAAKAASEASIIDAKMKGIISKIAEEYSKPVIDESKVASLQASYQSLAARAEAIQASQRASSEEAKTFAENVAKGATQASILEEKMSSVVAKIAQEQAKPNADAGKIASLAQEYQRLAAQLVKVQDASRGATPAIHETARVVAESADEASILRSKMEGIVSSIATELGKSSPDESKIASLSAQYQRLKEKLAEVQAQANETGKSLGKSIGDAADAGVSKFEKFASRVGRILSTMLIRNAMKTLVKAFNSAWDAMTNYSKAHGGELAQTMSMIRGAVSQAAVSLATALAPAMRFVAAAANVATGAIKVLANAINWLLGLLGMSTEFLGMSTEALDGYSTATGGASGANKDLIASFDELNVIQSSGGGGSPTGGGMDLSSFNEGLSAELAAIEMIIAESMLALGVILTFTGHPGIGIPLMILGLAGVVAETTINWGGLSEEVKGELLKIMVIAGGAMLAIGAIIACASTTHMALGIALMAAGAANIVGAVALSWGLVSGKVKDEIGKILVYVGTALLAIGAILALASPTTAPIGIALLAAGGISIASAIALNWDGIKTTVINTFNKIKEGIVNAWNNVKAAVASAWDAVVQWASAKWSDFARGWENIKLNLQKLWDKVSKAVVGAWEAVKTWLASKWSDFSRAWDRIKDGFDKIWDNVKGFVTGAWDAVVVWIEAVWTDFQNNWNNIKAGFEAIWIFIKTAVANAWLKVQTWINAKWTQFSAGWDYIKQQMEAIWNGIKEAANTAYEKAKEFLEKKWDDFESGWEDIKTNIGIVWGDIKQSAVDAYVGVQAWLVTTWKNFEKGWNNIKESMSAIWTSIKQSVVSAYNAVADWWGNMVGKIEEAWGGVSKWFYDNVTHPIEEAFNSVIDTIKGWINTVIRGLNKIGQITLPKIGIEFEAFGQQVSWAPSWSGQTYNLWHIDELAADGYYGLPKGDVFVANEAGPELVGSINGKSSVANQMQIIEAIRKGVHDANDDQNALLRQQNELLLEILQKDSGFGSDASIAFGRFAKRSIALYNQSMGGK